MISKQRGIIDPWSLGFLIGLTGLTIVQPWDKESDEVSKTPLAEAETTVVIKNQTTQQKHFE